MTVRPPGRRRNAVGRVKRAFLAFAVLGGAGLAFAQEEGEEGPPAEPLPPVYEEQLLRLSEILGALTFLRDLCGADDGAAWRDEMGGLLDAEQPTPVRRERLVARFNHGYETFHAVYLACTPSAELAIARYLDEGQRVAAELRERYGQ
jgi:uncharacterized protein (TIGR02301 family)